MLQSIRDRARGWIAYLIIFLVAIPFALWGIHNYFEGGGSRAVAKINGEEIPPQVVRNELLQQKARLREAFGGQLPEELFTNEALKEASLQRVVTREVLRQVVAAEGFRVSDATVLQALHQIDAFRENGQFSVARYERLLQARRMSKGQFEQQLRESMRLDQLVQGIVRTSFLPASMAADYHRLQKQTRTLALLTVPAAAFADQIDLTEADIEAYYAEHQDEFMRSERVKLDYVELSMGKIAETVSVVEDELRDVYRQNIERYREPEERSFRQILLQVPADADEAAWDEAKAQAESLQSKIQQGQSFQELAAQHSAAQLAASAGAKIGPVVRGDLSAAIDTVLFELQEGEVSEPLKTDKGYRLLQVVSITPEQTEPFEAVREEVEEQFRQRRAERRYIELTEQLLTVSFEEPDSLRPAAEATGLSVQTSDWITRREGSGIGQFTEVRNTAFAPEVLEERRNSDLIELPEDRAVVIRIAQHQEQAPRPLAEVRADVKQALQRERRQAKAAALADQLKERLAAGETLAAVAAGSVAELREPEPLNRDSEALPAAVLQRAFAMPAPTGDQPTLARIDRSNGDAVVILLKDVTPGYTQAEAPTEASQVAQNLARRELEAFQEALKAAAEVKIYRQNL